MKRPDLQHIRQTHSDRERERKRVNISYVILWKRVRHKFRLNNTHISYWNAKGKMTTLWNEMKWNENTNTQQNSRSIENEYDNERETEIQKRNRNKNPDRTSDVQMPETRTCWRFMIPSLLNLCAVGCSLSISFWIEVRVQNFTIYSLEWHE